MEYKKFKRRPVEQEAKELLSKGKTKQQVYDQLVAVYGVRRHLAELIRFTPYPRKLRLFRPMIIIYLIFLVAMTVLAALNYPYFIIAPLLMIYVVAFNRFRLYNWLTLLGILAVGISVGQVSISYMSEVKQDIDWILAGSGALFGIIAIWFGNYIPSRLTPPVNESKEFYTHPSGKKKLRLVHSFRD